MTPREELDGLRRLAELEAKAAGAPPIDASPLAGASKFEGLSAPTQPEPRKHGIAGLERLFTSEIFDKEIDESSKMLQSDSVIDNILGGLRYAATPITTVARGFVGEPVERVAESAGVPEEYIHTLGTIAEIAMPGIGVTRLPGSAAKAATVARVAESDRLLESLKTTNQRDVVNLAKQHKVPLMASMETQKPWQLKAEGALSELPFIGTQKAMESGQKAAARAANVAGEEAAGQLNAAKYRGLSHVENAAAGGDARAVQVVKDIKEAGEDWRLITKTSAGLKHFRHRELVSRMYDRVGSLAGSRQVDVPKTLQTLDAHIAKESASILRDDKTVNHLIGLRDRLQSGTFDFQQTRDAVSDVQDAIDTYYKGKGALIGEKGAGALVDVKHALKADLDAFAASGNAELKGAWHKADKFYGKYAETFKNAKLGAALKDLEPDALYTKFVQAGKEGHGALLYKALEPKGRVAVRAGMLENAVEIATDATGTFSPAKYASYLERAEGAAGKLFTKAEKKEMDGISKLMRHATSYGHLKEAPPTGARLTQLLAYGGTGAGLVASPMHAMAGVATIKAVSLLLTTGKGKAILRAASAAAPGSGAMKAVERSLQALLISRPLVTNASMSGVIDFAGSGQEGEEEMRLPRSITGVIEEAAGQRPLRSGP